MENQRPGHRLAALLVQGRHILFTVMAVLALVLAMMIPKTRINTDVTSNLPDDSPMLQGLSILEKDFPMMDIRMQTLRVMFWNEAPADSLQEAIEAVPGVTRWVGTEQRDTCTLYQFMLPRDAKGPAVADAVRARFGDRVVVEVEDNTNMPDNLVLMLVSGVAIALVILFLMCPSFMEPLLILFTLLIAVAINMGTNALLPSVYLVTHTLTAVLQMVLSMDFAIILMNRYRQEKNADRTNEEAMTEALYGAAPSILSSGLTTIASMMMLTFMRLKIGGDLGIVLSKGVFCSLLATFTVLPALVLRCDKLITRTEKPMLRISTAGLARAEMRFRVPLAVLFVCIFAGSWFLQKQTEISYSVEWPTTITQLFPPKNNMLVLYRTDDEEAFLPIAARVAKEPDVLSCLSYPSLALQPRTAAELGELAALVPGMKDTLPAGALDLVYYAATHPQRTERLRMDELEPTARELASLAAQYLPEDVAADMSARFDVDAMTRKLFAEMLPEVPEVSSEPEPEAQEEPQASESPEQAAEPAAPAERDTATAMAIPDTMAVTPTSPVAPTSLDSLSSYFNYENITQLRTSDEMAKFLGQDPKNTSLVYRLARTGRGGRPATMSAYEFTCVLTDKVLTNRLYASMLSADQKQQIRDIRQEFDALIAAGPTPVAEASKETMLDSLAVAVPTDSIAIPAVPDTLKLTDTLGLADTPEPATVAQPVPAEPSPVERLAEMAFSGAGYSSAQLYRALHQAGIPVSREEIDLLCLYHGYKTSRDTSVRLSLLELADWATSFAQNPLVNQYLDAETRTRLEGLRGTLDSELGALRSEDWSVAVIVSDFPTEGDATFAFLDTLHARCRQQLSGQTYGVGFSVMYKEMKEGFPRELLLLTLLTIAAIFLIVALTFRSLVVPFLLIPTVLSAVWLNVYASGLGGNTMLYVAYCWPWR